MAKRGRRSASGVGDSLAGLFGLVVLFGIPIVMIREHPVGSIIFISIIIGIIVGIIFLRKAIKKRRLIKLRDQRIEYYQYVDIDELDPFVFENFCAELLQDNGFSSYVTQKSYDMGVDVMAKKNGKTYAIQVKHYQGKVGNKSVQEAHGGQDYFDTDYAVVMTNSYFSNHAKQMAEKLNVVLWDRDVVFQYMANAREKYGKKIVTNAAEQYVADEKRKLFLQSLNGQLSTKKMLEKGKELDALLGSTTETDDSNMEYQPQSLYPKGVYNPQKDIYNSGCFIVGTDIPSGRYIFFATEDKGRVEIYKTFDDYKNDEMPEIHTFDDECRVILRDNGNFVSVENAEMKLVSKG